MRLAIGSDHRGFDSKHRVVEWLKQAGHEIKDVGTDQAESADYPDFARIVGGQVSSGEAERGILICGSGIGMSIAANKVHGVRAALCHNSQSAEMSRRHNDANVLCLSADSLDEEQMQPIVQTWLSTEFEGGRHARRVGKIAEIERDADS